MSLQSNKTLTRISLFILLILGCGPRSFPGYQYWPPEAQGKAK